MEGGSCVCVCGAHWERGEGREGRREWGVCGVAGVRADPPIPTTLNQPTGRGLHRRLQHHGPLRRRGRRHGAAARVRGPGLLGLRHRRPLPQGACLPLPWAVWWMEAEERDKRVGELGGGGGGGAAALGREGKGREKVLFETGIDAASPSTTARWLTQACV